MSLNSQERQAIIEQFGQSAQDTGSVEVQVALLTADIKQLTKHFMQHKKDNHSRTGMIRKVNLRRKLLKYLKRVDLARYTKLIADLELRG